MAHVQGIALKKKFGQHFLRDSAIVQAMLAAVDLTKKTSVFEIGCGDGFLTRAILETSIARLQVFEIDPDWVKYIQQTVKDDRLTISLENFLDSDLAQLTEHQPWTVLSNLPYNVTFPILHRFQENRHFLKEGVIMVQEEVAQKIVQTRGRGYGYPALFFQHYFEWKLLNKIPPTAFHPAPKVFSRLLYFKPRIHKEDIPQEKQFWEFIKYCFKQPRRTLKNNLMQTHYALERVPENMLKLRAQELTFTLLLDLWNILRV